MIAVCTANIFGFLGLVLLGLRRLVDPFGERKTHSSSSSQCRWRSTGLKPVHGLCTPITDSPGPGMIIHIFSIRSREKFTGGDTHWNLLSCSNFRYRSIYIRARPPEGMKVGYPTAARTKAHHPVIRVPRTARSLPYAVQGPRVVQCRIQASSSLAQLRLKFWTHCPTQNPYLLGIQI